MISSSQFHNAVVRDPLILSPETKLVEAIAQMSAVRATCQATDTAERSLEEVHIDARSSCVLVVGDRQLVGIVTERDIVRLIAQYATLDHLSLQNVMSHPVTTLHQAELTDFFTAINLLQQHHIRHVPLLNENKIIGLLTHESLRKSSRPVDLLRLRLVSEVMSTSVVYAEPHVTMLEIANLMSQHGVGCVVIVREFSEYPRNTQPDRNIDPTPKIPIGIITERDIVQFHALGLNLKTCLVGSVMSTPVFSVRPQDSLWVVHQLMEQRFVRRLAVTGPQGEMLGIVSQSSLLQILTPLELYKLTEVLETKVSSLEAEKLELLENRTVQLEQEVARQIDVLKTKATQAKLLATVSSTIHATLDLDRILKTTVEELQKILGCDRVAIWQLQEECKMHCIAEATSGKIHCLLGQSVVDSCFGAELSDTYHKGRIRVVPDIHTIEISDCHRALLERLQMRAKMLFPIVRDDALWGLLEATESFRPRQWKPEEAELLKQLATQLAIAIQQATAYQRLQEELVERQQTEIRLRESEQRFASLAAAAPVGIFRTDEKGLCIYVNERWCQIAGLTSEMATGRGWKQALHPDDRDLIAEEWDRSSQEDRPFQLEYRFQRPDGQITWVYGQSLAEYNEQQQIVGYVGTITDISDRKQAEQQRQASEQRFRQAIEQAPFPIMIHAEDGEVLQISNIWTELTGYTRADIPTTAAWAEKAYGDLASDVLKNTIDRRYHLRSRQDEGELTITTRERSQQIWHFSSSPLGLLPDGRRSVVSMAANVTERRTAELALQHLIAGTAATTGKDFFPALVRHIAEALNVAYVLVTEYVDDCLHTLALWAEDALQENISYNPAQTPCKHTLKNGKFVCQSLVQHKFPESKILAQMGAESYLGIAMHNARGEIMGNLCILDRRPLDNIQRLEQVLTVFASRCTTELERQRVSSDLEALNRELEERVEQRTEELRVKDAQLEDFFDNANDLIQSVLLEDGRFEYVNHAWQQALGYSEAEVAELTIFDLLHPSYHQHCIGLIGEMRQGKTCQLERIELIFLTKYGREIRLEGSVNCRLENGLPVATRAIFRDVTERHNLIQELVSFKQALDRSAIVAITDTEGIITYVNDRFCTISGYTKDELLGQTHQIINSGYHPSSFFQDLWETISSGKIWRGEICNKAKDGRLYWVDSTLVPFTDSQGKPFQYLAIRVDISDRKRYEEELQQTNIKLARATKLKDQFLANMSHELRTPLNAVLGMTEALQEGAYGTLNAQQNKALSVVTQSGMHLLELINDILDLAKIESGQVELEYSPSNIEALCQNSLVFIKQQAHRKQIQTQIQIPPNLPNVMLDERRIRQSLINLLNNAVKFTAEGGSIVLQVNLESDRNEATHQTSYWLKFTAIDTGIGISQENLQKLFQPFVQVDSALNRSYSGTGLGLSLVKRIVELHGGTLGVSSQEGVGSQFWFALPCGELAGKGAAASRSASPDRVETSDEIVPCRILLAEDNLANIKTIAGYLKAKGYSVILAYNGQQAIDLARAEQPDLILMDIQMPEVDGLEAMQAIRQIPSLEKTPIVALTALAMTGDRERCLAAGANDYLSKPIRLRQLMVIIQQYCGA
ncbi:PAS domain S-box protein [Roseofilum casamattae]|uniref:histidine kinase n=1 Tax=Roseofilum casamattae BLCC-M143 TaxID=3022442 RepID=A0ABT7BUL8_9CYAN|nr:PAS domain S-box protein [Roseofilum casamattae]MDJ1182881.1 PAS domain S-box protein [Roseofilum casamattae BLCC-M143]